MRPPPVSRFRGVLLLLLLAACGGGTGPNTDLDAPSVACAAQSITQLGIGDHAVVEVGANAGCLRLPAPGTSSAQYLMVLASTNGSRTTSGVKGPFLFRAGRPALANASPAVASVLAPSPSPVDLLVQPEGAAWRRSPVAIRFDAELRGRERQLLDDPRYSRPLKAPAPLAAPPPVGDVRSFKACANLQCTSFSTVTATARYVGTNSAVYLDNDAPTNDPLTDSDLAELGSAFDRFHYPIDTTAFGREPDIDGNGVVIILMTKAVNDLTPDCTNGRVVGFFYGGDLLTGPNANRAEIFYTLVPAPQTSKCSAVTRRAALNNLKPTLIHEFQHMISFNQHALVRGGSSEDVWLNESLSHFAEELGGRLIPNAECTPGGFTSCRAQYTSGNLLNAYEFMKKPGQTFLVFPNSTQGTLEERGAGWLFMRWVLDHFAADTIIATDLTRALEGTSNTGVTNLQAVTGASFSVMVPQWLMALYLDDGPDLPVEPTGRLRYKSWGFRAIFTDPGNSQVFPTGFPLVPLPVTAGSSILSKSDTLRAGTGYYFLLSQPANATGLDIHVTANSSGTPLDPALQARFGVVRIR